jgi:hypothetical protein
MEAMRQVSGQPPRSVPVERQYHIGEETLIDEHGTWNGRSGSRIEFQNAAVMTRGYKAFGPLRQRNGQEPPGILRTIAGKISMPPD